MEACLHWGIKVLFRFHSNMTRLRVQLPFHVLFLLYSRQPTCDFAMWKRIDYFTIAFMASQTEQVWFIFGMTLYAYGAGSQCYQQERRSRCCRHRWCWRQHGKLFSVNFKYTRITTPRTMLWLDGGKLLSRAACRLPSFSMCFSCIF